MTGSGKTYSMFGKDEEAVYGLEDKNKGIAPRAFVEIFNAIEERKQKFSVNSQLAVSYIEIFGEHVSDLLKNGARCGQSKVSSQRYVLNGAVEHIVNNMDDVLEVLRVGEQQKRRAATAMNDRSTRAHSLLLITLKQSLPASEVTLFSRLFFADLGGSEKVTQSKVEAGANRLVGTDNTFSVGFQLGENMREAVYINLGLLSLKKCIEALNNKSNYVPYQDSKLTMLLSEGIGGNSKTSILICSNMDPTHVNETVSTLRFGEKCALVETSTRNNATMLAGVLANIDKQIAELEAKILANERWESREETRKDELAEEGTYEAATGAMETKRVFVLVGAEEERKQLEKLLIRRAKFTGSALLDDDDSNNDPTVANTKKAKRVVGFGKSYAELYGLGKGFNEESELLEDNERFVNKVDAEYLPNVVRAKGKSSWATGEELKESAEVLEAKAMKIKRTRLAYSGLSV